MTYSIIDRDSGNVVASFRDESDARTWVEANIERGDEWGLVEFGALPTENRLVATWGLA